MTTTLIISLALLLIVSGAFYLHARRAAARTRQLTRQLDAERRRLHTLDRRADAEKFSLQTILASMAEGVIISDRAGVIQADNRAFREMFAIRDQAVGRRAWEVLRQPEIMPLITGVLSTGHPAERELVYEDLLAAGGRKKYVHVSVSALGGGGDGAVAVFHDISRVAQLEESRQEFVANVSHELRTPLSIFHGYLETLLDQPDLPVAERQRICQVMRRHSARLNALVDDLLTLSRMESGQMRLHLAPLPVARLFAQLREDWAPRCTARNCTLTFTAPDPALTVTADQFRLEQVFHNLLDNALKYSDAGGAVSVGASGGAREVVEFYVRDTGIGIPGDKVGQIFQRFYRVDKARSRDQGGTGLGLAIVKHIVQLHGGVIRAESALGKGTTVWFSIGTAER
jgi:two-component system phosphate regulon sensor histidine kinase PhoR